ncbi:hypothetical protein R5R35_000713 [Gryllus longicercus]|uniref:Uncharacterized protein n=1 Tax=Gryllus longicercus TaxID=2509291 RepID=A0AAN9VHG8_9ORTH
MEGIFILSENVIEVEDVKEEKFVIKEECNWNCVEEAESSAIPCSVKKEHDSDEEELERPVSVFISHNEDQERLWSVEEKVSTYQRKNSICKLTPLRLVPFS